MPDPETTQRLSRAKERIAEEARLEALESSKAYQRGDTRDNHRWRGRSQGLDRALAILSEECPDA